MAERYGGQVKHYGEPHAAAGSGLGLDGVDVPAAIPEIFHGFEDAGMRIAGLAKVSVRDDSIELFVPLDHGVPVAPGDGVHPDGGMWIRATRVNVDRGEIRWYVSIDVADLASHMYVDTATTNWTSDQMTAALDGLPDAPSSYNDPGVRERLLESQPISLRDATRIAAGRLGISGGAVTSAVDVTAQHRARLESAAAARAAASAAPAEKAASEETPGTPSESEETAPGPAEALAPTLAAGPASESPPERAQPAPSGNDDGPTDEYADEDAGWKTVYPDAARVLRQIGDGGLADDAALAMLTTAYAAVEADLPIDLGPVAGGTGARLDALAALADARRVLTEPLTAPVAPSLGEGVSGPSEGGPQAGGEGIQVDLPPLWVREWDQFYVVPLPGDPSSAQGTDVGRDPNERFLDGQEKRIDDALYWRRLSEVFVPGSFYTDAEVARMADGRTLTELFQGLGTDTGFGEPAGTADPTLDTGHYDDGHAHGWEKPEAPAERWTDLTASVDLDAETERIADGLQLDHEERMAEPTPPSTSGGNRKLVIGAVLVGLFGVIVAVISLSSGGDSSPSSKESDANESAADGGASGEAAAGPVRYQSNCNGPCFTKVDLASCERTFHFDLTILSDPERYEGTTAVISTTGPGMDPTYEVPVRGGNVLLDVVVPAAAYGGDPELACGANVTWQGLLTSVDGQPTITPDPPS